MLRQKHKTLHLAVQLLIVLGILFTGLGMFPAAAYAQSSQSPAGCPGGPAGPPAPGTICPDGKVALADSSLPLGCPGSAQQGPIPGNHSAQCPSRPGRSACTFTASDQTCKTASGQNVIRGDAAMSGANAARFQGDCKKEDITEDCGIVEYLRTFTRVLSSLVGIVIVIMITVGGIQYSAARDNPQATAAAKGRITNALIALVVYIFMFSLLQYLIPGGVL